MIGVRRTETFLSGLGHCARTTNAKKTKKIQAVGQGKGVILAHMILCLARWKRPEPGLYRAERQDSATAWTAIVDTSGALFDCLSALLLAVDNREGYATHARSISATRCIEALAKLAPPLDAKDAKDSKETLTQQQELRVVAALRGDRMRAEQEGKSVTLGSFHLTDVAVGADRKSASFRLSSFTYEPTGSPYTGFFKTTIVLRAAGNGVFLLSQQLKPSELCVWDVMRHDYDAVYYRGAFARHRPMDLALELLVTRLSA